MAKTIYVVSYTSYYCDLYNEVKLFESKDYAQAKFNEYVADIAMEIKDDEMAESFIEQNEGHSYLHHTLFGGEEFIVSLDEEEIG